MVYQAADGGIHIAGGHGAHQVKAHVNHHHVAVIRADVLHNAADQRLGQLGAGIADTLAHQILGAGYALIAQGQHNIQRGLHHRADGLHRHGLVGAHLDHILLVVQPDVSTAGSHQGNSVIIVGGEADIDLQALLCVVALLNGHIHEGMQGVGIPVQHHVYFPQGLLGMAGAGQQQAQGQQYCKKAFHHRSSFLMIRRASARPFFQ